MPDHLRRHASAESAEFRGRSRATRPGSGPDLPNLQIPRNLLLVRPTGKRKGLRASPPSSGEPPPILKLSIESPVPLGLGWRFPLLVLVEECCPETLK